MTQDDPRDKFRRLINSEEETRSESPSQAAGTPTPLARPALDKDNMPLPRRVDEIDTEGTRVTPAAFSTRTSPRNGNPPPVPPRSASGFNFNFPAMNWGCLIRGLIVVLFIFVIAGLCLGSLGVYVYYYIAS